MNINAARRLAKKLRPFVEKYDPVAVPIVTAVVVPPGKHHYKVVRSMALRPDWVLYDGISDQDATKWWDHVTTHKERGRMEFWHNGVLRDVYQGGK